MNSVSNNPFRGINTTIENNNIQNNTKPQINKVENTQQLIVENFVNKIKEEIEKAQLICIKIVRNEVVNKNELEFVTKKYPDMKQLTEECLRDYNKIVKELKLCKTHEQRQQLISKFSKEILNEVKKGYLLEHQAKIKMAVIEELIKFNENTKLEFEKAENIALKMIKGEEITSKEAKFLEEKYPTVRQLAEKAAKHIENLKLALKNCKTEQERQALLSKEIKHLDNKKNTLSKTEIKFKECVIKEIEKFLNKNKENIKKLQVVVLKIINDKNLNKSDEKFINEEYPNLKDAVYNEIKSYNNLKELPKNDKNKEQILSEYLKDIECQIKSGKISEYQAIIKKAIIENLKKDSKNNINYYINLYLNMIFTTVTENRIAIITLIVVILAITYIL